jgi:hypothetical protein
MLRSGQIASTFWEYCNLPMQLDCVSAMLHRSDTLIVVRFFAHSGVFGEIS